MFILASYRDFAVQSGTYCHKDSLFKDKVKPMQNTQALLYSLLVISNITRASMEHNLTFQYEQLVYQVWPDSIGNGSFYSGLRNNMVYHVYKLRV